MITILFVAVLATAGSAQSPKTGIAASATSAGLSVTPKARNLFEQDWVLMNWALKYFDANHDALLQPSEADAAAAKFRQIADTNGDGRITPQEYRAARELILSQ